MGAQNEVDRAESGSSSLGRSLRMRGWHRTSRPNRRSRGWV